MNWAAENWDCPRACVEAGVSSGIKNCCLNLQSCVVARDLVPSQDCGIWWPVRGTSEEKVSEIARP